MKDLKFYTTVGITVIILICIVMFNNCSNESITPTPTINDYAERLDNIDSELREILNQLKGMQWRPGE